MFPRSPTKSYGYCLYIYIHILSGQCDLSKNRCNCSGPTRIGTDVVLDLFRVLNATCRTIWYFDFQRTTGWDHFVAGTFPLIFRNDRTIGTLCRRITPAGRLVSAGVYGGYSLILCPYTIHLDQHLDDAVPGGVFAAAIEQGGRPRFYLGVLFRITLQWPSLPAPELLFGLDRDVPGTGSEKPFGSR